MINIFGRGGDIVSGTYPNATSGTFATVQAYFDTLTNPVPPEFALTDADAMRESCPVYYVCKNMSAADNAIRIEGRMHEDDPWTEIATVQFAASGDQSDTFLMQPMQFMRAGWLTHSGTSDGAIVRVGTVVRGRKAAS